MLKFFVGVREPLDFLGGSDVFTRSKEGRAWVSLEMGPSPEVRRSAIHGGGIGSSIKRDENVG